MALALALGRDNFWISARLRFVALTAIVLVGLVYSFALRSTWQPQGWQAVADHALHDATPVLFSLTWLLHRHGGLDRRDVVAALAWPSAYCAYALARGAIDDWYAYWFLNPNEMSFAELAVSIALMLAAFLTIAAALLVLDRWLARKTG